MSGQKQGTTSGQEEEDEILVKLESVGDKGWFLWKIFFLCTIPTIMNGLHVTSYVYLAEVPDHWCLLPELSVANWTDEQLRLILNSDESNKSSCDYYNWDYEKLSKLNFTEAFEAVKTQKKPELIPCSKHSYAEGSSSIVVDYDLVCQRIPLKSMIQVSLSLGKFLGALVFGMLSDKYGRKFSFLLGCLLYMVSGPLVAFAFDYSMIIAGRIGLGAASMAIYNSAYVILSEIASKNRRSILVILYNMSYPIGQMIVPLLAYFFRDWRTLQTIISIPSLFLFAFYWFLPESPRWLILNNRRIEAGKIIEKAYLKISQASRNKMVEKENCEKNILEEKTSSTPKDFEKPDKALASNNDIQFWKKIWTTSNQTLKLLKHFELRCRLLVALALWCVCSMSYYVLALNVDNFLADRYLYGFVCGLVEVPSYILPLPLLKCFGRRTTSIVLFYIGGFSLLFILVVPRHEGTLLLVVASLGRLCISAVFAIVTLHTTEIFPTVLRNTAVGCCSTAAHIGSMSAPFIVDILGGYAWFIPSTVCGVVTILAGTIISILPETKNKKLPETVEDITNAAEKDKIGFHQICSKKSNDDSGAR